MDKSQFMVGVSWNPSEYWDVAFISSDEWDQWDTIVLSEDGVNTTGATLPEDGWAAFFGFINRAQSKLTARGLASSQDIRPILANVVLKTARPRPRLITRGGKRV